MNGVPTSDSQSLGPHKCLKFLGGARGKAMRLQQRCQYHKQPKDYQDPAKEVNQKVRVGKILPRTLSVDNAHTESIQKWSKGAYNAKVQVVNKQDSTSLHKETKMKPQGFEHPHYKSCKLKPRCDHIYCLSSSEFQKMQDLIFNHVAIWKNKKK